MDDRGCVMRQRVLTKEQIVQKSEKPACHHFWVIDEANGPSSFGTCKHCGEKKEFLNAFPTFNPLKKNATIFKLPRLAEIPVKKTDTRGAVR
jgi:hypothetical protein